MKDDIFDVAVSEMEMGRLFEYSSKESQVIRAFDEVKDYAEGIIAGARRSVAGLPEVNFRFIESTEVNAVAFKEQGCYFIGITTGAIIVLRAVINRLLSDPEVFRNIGDPQEESSTLQKVERSTYEWILLQAARISPPKNRIRNIHAGVIYRQALLFLIGHELAHITRGHVDYFSATYGIRALMEVVRPGGERFAGDALESQCMELDADRRAIKARIFTARLDWNNAIGENINLTSVRHTPAQLFFDLGSSINIFFRMFGDSYYSATKQSTATHPANAIRRLVAVKSAEASAGDTWKGDYEALAATEFAKSIDETENAFEIISGESSSRRSYSGLAKANSPDELEAISHLMRYTDGEMRVKLKAFSFENLD